MCLEGTQQLPGCNVLLRPLKQKRRASCSTSGTLSYLPSRLSDFKWKVWSMRQRRALLQIPCAARVSASCPLRNNNVSLCQPVFAALFSGFLLKLLFFYQMWKFCCITNTGRVWRYACVKCCEWMTVATLISVTNDATSRSFWCVSNTKACLFHFAHSSFFFLTLPLISWHTHTHTHYFLLKSSLCDEQKLKPHCVKEPTWSIICCKRAKQFVSQREHPEHSCQPSFVSEHAANRTTSALCSAEVRSLTSCCYWANPLLINSNIAAI